MDCPGEDAVTTLPAEMPVMVLPDCHLFPGCLLPLYIFEERYRRMLAHALGANRMFCIGNREGDGEDAPISPYSTAGLVRACVKQDDGTSHLLLLGLKRIRLTRWTQEKPFRIASIEVVETDPGDPVETAQLCAETLELFGNRGGCEMEGVLKMLRGSSDAESVCDVISYHFTRCPKLQQKLLAETSLTRRYKMVIEALKKTDCQ